MRRVRCEGYTYLLIIFSMRWLQKLHGLALEQNLLTVISRQKVAIGADRKAYHGRRVGVVKAEEGRKPSTRLKISLAHLYWLF